jgi:molybdopterin/thiamine biosynthesis adenylyltransferase
VDKYARQRGLVAQDIIADAHVSVYGTGPALPYLLQCLVLAGTGTRYGSIRLCGEERPVTAADLANQFFLRRDDLGKPIRHVLTERVIGTDDAVDIAMASRPRPRSLVIAAPVAAEVADIGASAAVDAWGQVLPTAVYIGPDPLPVDTDGGPNVLTAALAATCGGLLAQTVLGQLGALIAGPAVLSRWTEERLWLSYPAIGVHARAAMMDMAVMTEGPLWPSLSGVLERSCPAEVADRFQILVDWRPIDARITTVIDDDAVLVSAPVTGASAAAPFADVRPHLAVPSAVRPFLWSPVEGPVLDGDHVSGGDIPLPSQMPPVRVVVCGTGALGSWATAVLAASRFPDVDICLVDMDDTIEAHNLNRQVLFGETDIGQPKVRRAMERLGDIDPRARLRALRLEINRAVLDEISEEVEYQLLGAEFEQELAAYQAQVSALRSALSEATAVLSCPDNHQTRWYLNVIAERLGVPLVNGAMEGFVGRVHVCDPSDHGQCLVCWLGASIAKDTTRQQCTGLQEDAPVPSIVTSAAIVGAMQAAALIAMTAGLGNRVRRFHRFNGMTGSLLGYRAADRDPLDCPAHLFSAGDGEPSLDQGRESDGSAPGRLQDR